MARRGFTLSRRGFMARVAGGLAAATGLSCASTHAAQGRRPNVIFAFSDEHRWQSMSTGEMPEVQTPNMAALAAQGVQFTHCISNYPVCSPHRAILLTGQWPYTQGVIDNDIALKPTEDCLGHPFRRAGYRTGYIGKWHLGGTRAEPFGFDTSLIWTGTNRHWDVSKYHPAEGDPVQPKGYNATLMTDQALDFIESHQRSHGGQPFMLVLSWNPPHSDFLDPPEAKKALYGEGSLPWRPNVPEELRRDTGEKQAIWDKNGWPYYRGYHGHISAIDDELGRIMGKLEALGIADNTILVYSADHGTMMGSHGLGGKRLPYEESIRVPLLIRWPKRIPAGARMDDLVGTIDLMPTLCGLAGVDVPEVCHGRNLSPLALGAKMALKSQPQILMHISKDNASGGQDHPAPLFRGVRTERYTYATYPDKPWFLFDNIDDPYQLRNLIDMPDYATVRQELESLLKDLLVKAGDPFEILG